MASPHQHSIAQNKGPLVPGQTISVNKYTVQVERYLSQGGFAHVYLVRTRDPVYNTTHHVLKRIAVTDYATLTEVKKEVDIMRLLKGHPNIVYLIDAAWHRLSNGTYEVFILMEFCAGGGIIDMMNRRLRERLTEVEILQIFVDVCEGVAYMHNLRPALLHRDLKVENILQSSPTSFKICDFGSATSVTRPPGNTQEINALETDLCKHTTLQYRAPEMIDVYQRKPVDEKSDVWALGVLLYKLCYYTTPFEEHGPLAILKVQYRIPSFPVYSPQMNELIGSMLQENGMRRPTVFQLLDHVHLLRCTTSRFQYSAIVSRQLSPNRQNQYKSCTQYAVHENNELTNPLSMSVMSPNGKQARDKVLDAIAPMLGKKLEENGNLLQTVGGSLNTKICEAQLPFSIRPNRPIVSRSLSTSKASISQTTPSSYVQKVEKTRNLPDPGGFSGKSVWKTGAVQEKDTDEDFREECWKDQEFYKIIAVSSKPIESSKRFSALGVTDQSSLASTKNRDAFEGLGLPLLPSNPAPTLGEARKLRTGLAVMNSEGRLNNVSKAQAPFRFSPSPFRSTSPSNTLDGPSFSPTYSSSRKGSPSPRANSRISGENDLFLRGSLSSESRFPSLEELDGGFPVRHVAPLPSTSGKIDRFESLRRRSFFRVRENPDYAMKSRGLSSDEETELAHRPGLSLSKTEVSCDHASSTFPTDKNETISWVSQDKQNDFLPLPLLERCVPTSSSPLDQIELRLSPTLSFSKPVDWLSGEAEEDSSFPPPLSSVKETPILRDSPRKRASVVIPLDIMPVQDVVISEQIESLTPSASEELVTSLSSYSLLPSRIEAGPSVDIIDGRKRLTQGSKDHDSSSTDDGPEDTSGSNLRRKQATWIDAGNPRRARKTRQNSVHDLVDLYGGGIVQKERLDEKVCDLEIDQKSPFKSQTANSNLQSVRCPISLDASTSRHVPNDDVRKEQRSRRVSTEPPTKSRPKSMFIFPSKSSDDYIYPSPQPPGFLPPPPEMTHKRRTSISDMVQHFEEMCGAKHFPAQRIRKRLPAISTDGTSHLKALNASEKTRQTLTIMSLSETPFGTPHRAIASVSSTSDTKKPSLRNDTSPQDLVGMIPQRSPHRTTISSYKIIDTSLPPTADSRASSGGSSPLEQSYQGVGKLIEQWQRKSEEADSRSVAAPRRSGFLSKR